MLQIDVVTLFPKMFDAITEATNEDLDSPFAGITDEDIDSLFS